MRPHRPRFYEVLRAAADAWTAPYVQISHSRALTPADIANEMNARAMQAALRAIADLYQAYETAGEQAEREPEFYLRSPTVDTKP